MSDLIIPEPLASRIQEIAKQEQLLPEKMLEILVDRYYPPPRPKSSLPDELIDVPDDIDNPEAYREATRAIRPKLYRIARRYWQKVGDRERLKMTDEELDKVFWLIDHEGIPRFLSEKDQVTLPPDPFDALIGLIKTDDSTLSQTVRETMLNRERIEDVSAE